MWILVSLCGVVVIDWQLRLERLHDSAAATLTFMFMTHQRRCQEMLNSSRFLCDIFGQVMSRHLRCWGKLPNSDL